MHLWPSVRIRESFRKAYLDKLELNLHRMKRDKKHKQKANQQKLLDDDNGGGDDSSSSNRGGGDDSCCGLLRDLLLIISCCYCCFCCGVCVYISQPVTIVSDDTEGKMGKHPISEANESGPFGSLTESEFYERHSLSHSSEFITNPRGLKLYTHWWVPLNSEPIGTVCVVHGFTGESNWFVLLTAVFLAKSGFATCAIDHQGHGFSDGLRNHIPDVEPVIDDCVAFFDSFRGKYPPDLPSFLYSESLGGAIALLITLRRSGPNAPVRPFNGVVLNGAMCGVSQKYKPPWPLEHFLSLAATLVPTWEIIPVKGSIPDVSFKVEWKRKMAFSSPRRRAARPRAATARELVRICSELQSRFAEVDVPFLIIHGGDDVICDPACVEELFKHASSKDKTIRIFPGMWHQLIGEPDEDVDMIFKEVVEWLRTRAERATAGN